MICNIFKGLALSALIVSSASNAQEADITPIAAEVLPQEIIEAQTPGTPFGDLFDVNGDPITNEADLGTGKWQVVMIWATDCHICAEMKPILSKFHDKHKDSLAQVYGVALDGPDEHAAVKKYMKDHKVTFPTYIGHPSLISLNLEINYSAPLRGTPTYLLFNPEGEILAYDFGYLNVDSIENFIEANT